MFQTLREPPKKGSLRESVLLLYCLKREEIEYMRDLAIAQIQITKDKGVEFFNDYRKAMFPWIETAKVRDDDQHRKLLAEAVKVGPLSVRAMNTKPLKSRLVKQVEKRSTEADKRRQNELYKKLGKSLPI